MPHKHCVSCRHFTREEPEDRLGKCEWLKHQPEMAVKIPAWATKAFPVYEGEGGFCHQWHEVAL